MKSSYIQYYVEGEDEEKLLNTLKTDLGIIRPGKIQKFNVIQELFTAARFFSMKPGTMAVLVFDTDTGQVDILKQNIAFLEGQRQISEIVTIPQVPDLEGELIRSCKIRKVEELLDSKSRKDFKTDLIKVSNLGSKLCQHHFDIQAFWSKKPTAAYQSVYNQPEKVKLIPKPLKKEKQARCGLR